jgi:hypothetical protein
MRKARAQDAAASAHNLRSAVVLAPFVPIVVNRPQKSPPILPKSSHKNQNKIKTI